MNRRRPPTGRGRSVACAVLLTIVAVASGPSALHPHGGRRPLEEWGGFPADVSRCQRAIGYAASYCASRGWRLLERCRSAQLGGEACNEEITAARINLARTTALNHVDEHCTERQLQDLSFLGSFDVQTDLIDFCRDWRTAAESAVFGPFRGGARQPPPDQEALACVAAAAAATTRLMSYTFVARRRSLDRIAVSSYPVDEEVVLYESATEMIQRASDWLTVELSAACPASAFRLLYGKEPRAFLEDVGIQADCLGPRFYIQDRFLCPDAVCGNGVVEPGEECDDANRAGGDGCDAACRSEP